MLTEKARYERMWGSFPSLVKVLSGKSVPDHYFGFSSVSDNRFEQISRLMTISILIRENMEEIKGQLATIPQLKEELLHIAHALEGAARQFHGESMELIQVLDAIHPVNYHHHQ